MFNEKVIPLFTLSLIFTFMTSFFGLLFIEFFINIFVLIGLVIIGIIVLIPLITIWKESIVLLFIFNLIEGFILTPLIYIANVVDPWIIPEALGITSLIFIVFSFYGWITKRDFTSWGSVLFCFLIVAFVFTILQFFIRDSIFNLLVDAGVIILFVFFIIYDMSSILREYRNNEYIPATVSLYLDFLNIFVRVVAILIRREE